MVNVGIVIFPHILASDLLYDILKYLPLKSLFRFALVCKRWHALITKDESFRRSVISNQNTTPLGLVICSGYEYEPVLNFSLDYLPFSCAISPLKRLDFAIEGSYMIALQSCNGLLLCSSHRYYCDGIHNGMYTRYFVCNPTTKKIRHLPAPDAPDDKVMAMCLAFDPAKSHYYKALAVMKVSRDEHQIYIFSSDTGVWILSGDRFLYDHIDYDEGVYWNGGIHWIDARHRKSSVYFNIENGMLKTMPSLPIKSDRVESRTFGKYCEKNQYYFGESCGNLHFVESGFMLLDIYEMKRDYSEWFIKQSVDLLDMTMGDGFGIFSIVCDVFTILSVVCGEKDDDSFIVLSVSGKILRCNLVSKTCERLRNRSIPHAGRMSVFHYIESLCHG